MNNGPKIHGERCAYTGDFGLVLNRPWSTYERGGHCGIGQFVTLGKPFLEKRFVIPAI
jgi:hypothetical protein